MIAKRAACVTLALIVLGSAADSASAQRAAPAASTTTLRSAPISNVRYEVTFNAQTAQRRSMHVDMTFDAAAGAPVLLSLPVWTPGAYEVSDYAHWVYGFDATARGAKLQWDKVDPDTWRVRPVSAGPVTVSFDYLADSLDNAMAWSRPDFLFFNGTTVFLYPEGRSLDFPATVTVRTDAGWNVTTSMRARPGRFTYGEGNYHDLVDMPFFVGRFDVDSMQVAGKWHRLATYPAGALQDTARAAVWRGIARMAPAEAAVFDDAPWPDYTTMMVFPEGYGGGSALEHSRSHLGIYTPELIGTPLLLDITAHEMFHSWNVKRLRPADMWPYAYDRAMPTTWLWVSEGITDYYAPLALVRGGIEGEEYLWQNLSGKMAEVDAVPPVALEDASLSTWIHPQDGTGYIYYPKGALAGFLLDVMIRDASDNRRSLDTVMRELYEADYKRGRGFTGAEWWAAVSRAAGGRPFADFAARYVDGREPFPYARVLPLAGLRIEVDTQQVARLGVQTQTDSAGERVTALVPGGMAERAGLQVGDYIVSLGDVKVTESDFGPAYRQRYGTEPEGTRFPIVVRRAGRETRLQGYGAPGDGNEQPHRPRSRRQPEGRPHPQRHRPRHHRRVIVTGGEARMDQWFSKIAEGGHLPPGTASALTDEGFAVIPGPIAPDALSDVAAAYDAAMAAAAGTPDHRDGSTTTRLLDLVNRGAAFDPIYVHPPLLEAAARVIGGPFRLSSMLARTLRPGTAAQELHADLPRDDPARPMVGFIFMLDPFRPDNGATRVIPGSHRWPEVPEAVMSNPGAARADEVLACGPAGAMLVFDASLWHGHTANTSGAPRRSIQGYFIPRGAPSGFDLPSRMQPETLDRIGPLARYVLAMG